MDHNMGHDDEVLVLTAEQDVNPKLAALVKDFGKTPDVAQDRVEIRIGSRPICYDLARLFHEAKQEPSPGMKVLSAHFSLWLLLNTVSVLSEPGGKKVDYLDFEISFPEEPYVTVVDLLPQTEFVTAFRVGGSARLECSASFDFSGDQPGTFASSTLLEAARTVLEMSGVDGKVEVSAKAGVMGKLSFAVRTAKIQAVGAGDHYSRWILKKDENSLIGQHAFAQILLTSSVLGEVNYDARVGITMATFFSLPKMRRSEWKKLSVTLKK
jgi:hypothetical protein